MAVQTRTIEAPGGRSLAVYEAGDPGGAPVLFHHGTPSSGVPWETHDRLGAAQGIRLVSYDRPGYGASTRAAGRAVADVAIDSEAIADALGLDRFATWGLSGGGPHALACAAGLPDRVAAVASVAGVAPYGVDGLDWLAGMGEGNIEEFGAALEGEAMLRPLLEQAAESHQTSVEELVESMSTLLSPPDLAAVRTELGAHLRHHVRRGARAGRRRLGRRRSRLRPPVGLRARARSAVPVLVVQGRQDLMVPGAHGDWLAARLPGAEAWFSEDEGHLTLWLPESVRRIHEWLLARL